MNESEIITSNLEHMIDRLSEQGVSIGMDDVHYSIMNREEWIYINSDIVLEGYDVPSKFGVYRGYAGGDIHMPIITTEIERIPKSKHKPTQKLLDIFKDTFKQILRDIDNLTYPDTDYEDFSGATDGGVHGR